MFLYSPAWPQRCLPCHSGSRAGSNQVKGQKMEMSIFLFCLKVEKEIIIHPISDSPLGPQDVPKGGLGQEPGAVMCVFHIGHTYGGVTNSVVHHRVNRNCHAVLRQYLNITSFTFNQCILLFMVNIKL